MNLTLKFKIYEKYRTQCDAARQFGMREDLVLAAIMGGASSISEITLNPIIYPSLTNLVYLQFETWMIEHHVAALIDRDLVEERKGKLVSL